MYDCYDFCSLPSGYLDLSKVNSSPGGNKGSAKLPSPQLAMVRLRRVNVSDWTIDLGLTRL